MKAIDLIYEVKKHKALYAKNNPDHKNKRKRAQAWANVGYILNSTVQHCQIKWRAIRNRFVREYVKKISTVNEDQSKPETVWRFYNDLKFLTKYIRPYKVVKMASEDIEEFLDSNDEQNDVKPRLGNFDVVESLMYENDICVEIEEKMVNFMNRMEAISKSRDSINKTSNFDPFLSIMAKKLDQLSKNEQDDVKIFFLNYLHKKIKLINKSVNSN